MENLRAFAQCQTHCNGGDKGRAKTFCLPS